MKRKCLAIGIILLFVGTCIIPTTAQNTEKLLPSSRGNWLYVGGSGPGNYTKIQDAVNNASNGDTVYVYDDSSPYYENLIINKSINLIGENKINTVILGEQNDVTIQIISDKVNVSGFNINNPGWRAIGISISSDFNIINDNNISGVPSGYGITLYWASYNEISNNIIDNNYADIFLRFSSNNSIFNNIIRYTRAVNGYGGGIAIFYDSKNNKIFGNLIEHCQGLVLFAYSEHNNIYENSIVHCSDNVEAALQIVSSNYNIIYNNNIAFNPRIGISLYNCEGNQIMRNNFLFNLRDASFGDCLFNHWLGNYWQRPRILPKVIFGSYLWGATEFITIPLFRFDIHPALIPIYVPPAGCDT